MLTEEFLQRFWSKVDKTSHPACWLWTAAKDWDGYGKIGLGERSAVGAHRISLELKLGRSLGPGLQACHSCDNASCVNPDHLWEGTTQQNTADRHRKGRSAIGTKQAAAKLTEELVRQIRASKLPSRKAAEIFGICKTQVLNIRHRRQWGHVK